MGTEQIGNRPEEEVVREAIGRYLRGEGSGGDGSKRTKTQLAQEAGLSIKTIYNITKQHEPFSLTPHVRMQLARVLDLDELNDLTAGKPTTSPPLPRLKPSMIMVILPALGASRFWTQLLFTVVDKTSPADVQKTSAPGAKADVQALTYSIATHCHREQWRYLQQFFAYCRKYRRQIGGVICAVPMGTENDAECKTLIDECEQTLIELQVEGCPVVLLDRYLRSPDDGSHETPLERIGIPMIGPDNRAIGRAIAVAIKEARNDLNPRQHDREPLRIEILGTTPRSIPEQLRLQGIEDELRSGFKDDDEYAKVFTVRARWTMKPEDSDSSREKSEELINSAIKDVLSRRPHITIGLTSIVAELIHKEVQPLPEHQRTAILTCDSAGMVPMLEDICYVDYSPIKLAEDGFACWNEIGPEKKNWSLKRNWCMETPVKRQRVLTAALSRTWSNSTADVLVPQGSYGQLLSIISEMQRDIRRLADLHDKGDVNNVMAAPAQDQTTS